MCMMCVKIIVCHVCTGGGWCERSNKYDFKLLCLLLHKCYLVLASWSICLAVLVDEEVFVVFVAGTLASSASFASSFLGCCVHVAASSIVGSQDTHSTVSPSPTVINHRSQTAALYTWWNEYVIIESCFSYTTMSREHGGIFLYYCCY